MILQLELSPEAIAQLKAEAAKRGLSEEDYARQKLLMPEPVQEETAGEALLRLAERMRLALGEKDWNSLPPDFATHHNHYIHGAPREEE